MIPQRDVIPFRWLLHHSLTASAAQPRSFLHVSDWLAILPSVSAVAGFVSRFGEAPGFSTRRLGFIISVTQFHRLLSSLDNLFRTL
jgi:hypothetical protein